MPGTKTDRNLVLAFAQLSQAAARRKIYARKAARDGRPDVARFLRAMGASEAVQARRLLNSLIGRIDTSGGYLETIFAEEIPAVLENYTKLINNTKAERPALLQAISQLRAAEKRLRSLYSQQNRDVKIKKNAKYFVCYFCGYLDTDSPPEKCPICGAARDAFRETN